jgi:hypothetical protein
MKRVLLVLLALLVVVGLFQFNTLKLVSARRDPVEEVLPLAPNSWDSGEETSVDFEAFPAPDWLQLLANPVKITAPGTVCHDFRAGQFAWTPEIRHLVDGVWVKVSFTAGWVPNEEGKYVVCFNAASKGIYALFGYYDPPPGYVEPRPRHVAE